MAEDTSFTTDIVVETWKTLQEYIPEKDKSRAEQIAGELSSSIIICGDPLDEKILNARK